MDYDEETETIFEKLAREIDIIEENDVEKFNELNSQPVKVGQVKFEGVFKTRPYVFEREFENVYNATTLKELDREIKRALNSTKELDIVNPAATEIKLDVDEAGNTMVDVKVEEKPYLGGGIQTQMNNQMRTTVGGELHVRNLLGHAEQFKISLNTGARKNSVATAQLILPHFLGYNRDKTFLRSLIFAGSKLRRDFGTRYGLCEESRGFSTHVQLSRHLFLNYRLDYRQVHIPIDAEGAEIDAPFSVREESGTSLSSSVGATYSYATVSSSLFPAMGYTLRVSEKFAGLGGDAKHFNSLVAARAYLPLGRFMALEIGAYGNVIVPLQGKPLSISDRIFMGDPYVRGFGPRTIGQKTGGTNLGGNIAAAATASVSFLLPYFYQFGFRGHCFVDAGNLVNSQKEQFDLKSFVNGARITTGAGVAWSTGLGTIEFNYCHPIRKDPADSFNNYGVSLRWSPFQEA
eukprot:GEZU01042139.1.p1 GENE.GEZU01042139.1~~GEZU01042139.1.p1  ORF type:complete len:462 (-),score=125.11 GEZU01042139.1:32-1417(-)